MTTLNLAGLAGIEPATTPNRPRVRPLRKRRPNWRCAAFDRCARELVRYRVVAAAPAIEAAPSLQAQAVAVSAVAEFIEGEQRASAFLARVIGGRARRGDLADLLRSMGGMRLDGLCARLQAALESHATEA